MKLNPTEKNETKSINDEYIYEYLNYILIYMLLLLTVYNS